MLRAAVLRRALFGLAALVALAAPARLLAQPRDDLKARFAASYQKWRQRQAAGDYYGAFEQGAASLETILAMYGADHAHSARVFSELGELQVLLNNFPEADELLARALEIRRKQLGDEHVDVADTLLATARLGLAAFDFELAAESLNEAVKILAPHEDQQRPRLIAAQLLRATLHVERGEPGEAEKAAHAALEDIEKLPTPDPILAAEAQLVFARALGCAGEYRQALDVATRASESLATALKQEHPRRLWAGFYRAQAMSHAGDKEPAERLLLDVLQSAEGALGGDHLLVAYCHNNLGVMAIDRGDYASARRHLTRALEIKEFRQGADNFDTSLSLVNVANIMFSTGQYEASLPLYERCLEIREETLGDDTAPYAQALMSLANLAHVVGEGDEALEQLEDVLAILRKRLGDEHPDLALALINHAVMLKDDGQLDESQKSLDQALAIVNRRLPSLDSKTIAAKSLAAHLLMRRGEVAEARHKFEEMLAQFESAYGADSPAAIPMVAALAQLAAASGDFDQVLDLSNRQRRSTQRQVVRVLPTLSAQAQLHFLRTTDRPNLQSALAWAWLRIEDARFVDASAEWLINGKSVALAALTQQTTATRDLTDPEVVSLRQRLLDLNRRMAGALFTNIGDDHWIERIGELAELEEQHADVSQMLAERVPLAGNEARWFTLDEVRQRIPPDAVLVEFSRLRRPENDEGEVSYDQLSAERYVAWIIPPIGAGPVEMVDLDLAERVDEMASFLRRALFASFTEATEEDESEAEAQFADATATLARSLLRPLEARAGDAKHWILCPDGMLWLVPWCALPYDDGTYVVERHQITQISTSRELLAERVPASTEPALIVADPNYNQGLDEPPSRAPFALLPQTVTEAQSIMGPVEKITQTAPRLLLGDEALEATVKATARPSLVMLSTHGFSLGSSSEGGEHNPLLRCGLAFAGANRAAAAAADAEDGVLSGLEVAGLDLRGTRLVMLSACDTAVGQVNAGEGVASLQRAFLLAGAQQVVSTVWPVPVDGTVELVVKFFETLAEGGDASTALRGAQLFMIKSRREKVKGAHPMHWGAFSITGWSPGI